MCKGAVLLGFGAVSDEGGGKVVGGARGVGVRFLVGGLGGGFFSLLVRWKKGLRLVWRERGNVRGKERLPRNFISGCRRRKGVGRMVWLLRSC